MPETEEKFVEVKPVVSFKSLHKCVRNILFNEFKMEKKDFEQKLNERVEKYIKGPEFERLVDQQINRVFASHWGNGKERLTEVIGSKINQYLDQMIGEAVRNAAKDRLREVLEKK